VIAGTVEAAKRELAATMQRQLSEETIEKSRTAAQHELGRAAHVESSRPTASPGHSTPTLAR
jgi:hypothetical protein